MNLPNKFLTDKDANKWIKEFKKEHPEVNIKKKPFCVIVEWRPEGEESTRLKVRFIKIGDVYAGGR